MPASRTWRVKIFNRQGRKGNRKQQRTLRKSPARLRSKNRNGIFRLCANFVQASQNDALAQAPGRRFTILAFVLAACLVALAFPAFTQQPKSRPQIDSLYRQGLAAVKRGDLANARTFFQQVVKLAPGNPEGHNSLGWVLFSQGQTADAISQLQIALRLKPDFPASPYQSGQRPGPRWKPG